MIQQKKTLRVLVDRGFSSEYEEFLSRRFNAEFIVFGKDKDGKFPKNIDLLLFTGGADVSPNFYGENKGNQTSTNIARDEEENIMFNTYNYLPKLGICRGSQFLTVMCGGKLIQHVNGHLGNHKIHIKNNDIYDERLPFSEYEITSTHHQMMYPFLLQKESYEIIGWSKKFLSNTYLNGNNTEIELTSDFLEPEIVYYKEGTALCVQGHPEMNSCPKVTSDKILNLIYQILIKKNSYNNQYEKQPCE